MCTPFVFMAETEVADSQSVKISKRFNLETIAALRLALAIRA
ncbi:Hypothetical protein ABZS17G119_04076 [Kosakonia cowanii]